MTNGKNSNNKSQFQKKIKRWAENTGFYLIVIVGLCIVAVATVFYTTNRLTPNKEKKNNQTQIQNQSGITDIAVEKNPYDSSHNIRIEDIDKISDDKKSITDIEENEDPNTNIDSESFIQSQYNNETIKDEIQENLEENIQENPEQKGSTENIDKTDIENNDTVSQEEVAQPVINLFKKEPKMQLPVQGKIINDYAMDSLIYSKTLDEWRTHSGIDIEAPRGEVVKAAFDGTVSEITNDPRYGITIVIKHENGYKTVYSNLGSNDVVSPNQKIKVGEPISTIGTTAIFECADSPHLHFEVYKDDKADDPKKYLILE